MERTRIEDERSNPSLDRFRRHRGHQALQHGLEFRAVAQQTKLLLLLLLPPPPRKGSLGVANDSHKDAESSRSANSQLMSKPDVK